VRYCFPATRGETMRGVPTGYAAPPLQALICVRRRRDCRFVDLLPTDPFSALPTAGYPLCVATAEPTALPSGVTVRVIQAPVFVGTKLDSGPSTSGPHGLKSAELQKFS